MSNHLPDNKPDSDFTLVRVDGVKLREKSAWVKACQRRGMKLVPWIIDTLNREAENPRRDKPNHKP